MQPEIQEHKNLIIALSIGMIVMIGWQVLYEAPRQKEYAAAKKAAQERLAALPKDTHVAPQPQAGTQPQSTGVTESSETPAAAMPSRADALGESPRIAIVSDELHGSIALRGARFDDMTLGHYRETLEADSPEVTLLSPSRTETAYFAEFGWLATGGATDTPDANTLWRSDDKRLTPHNSVLLYWDSPQGVRFEMEIAMDEHYMFTVTQRIDNQSGAPLSLAPYALINRSYVDQKKHTYILHEGPLGLKDDALYEVEYKDLREEGPQTVERTYGWMGITDKYWLTALAPEKGKFKVHYQHYPQNGQNRYQADLTGDALKLAPGGNAAVATRFFAGAKEVWLLDKYAQEYSIPLFDRAVDFGTLYFLTKPIFLMLDYFYSLLGNFGLAILLLTVAIKLVLFPLANKSYSSMAQMKALMPKMEEIRGQYAGDPVKMNQEIIGLYKREGVNPASGCLPMLVQIPIFFSLYKVLYVTIEMRHAPFFGWVRDLSATDPTNAFTLFGLISWDPPSYLHIGALPLLLCVTMIVQQRVNPKPADPAQAMVMQYLPYVFLFVFAGFPAGLVIYWTWNNILSILQQLVISHNVKKNPPKKRRGKPVSKEA